MAISREIWVNYIVGNLFKDQEFLNHCFDESANVISGKVVHIPNAGAKPGSQKNRSSLPASVVQRVDEDIVYVLEPFTSDPTLITNAEQYELSYDKIASVLEEHLETLREHYADERIIQWLAASTYTGSANTPAAAVLRTTGTNIDAYLPSATGTRKILTADDIKAARTRLNKQNIPKTDRYAMLSSEGLDQLMSDPVLKARDSSMELDMKNGVIARLYGFNILERSTTSIYTNASTPVVKELDAEAAATDNDAVAVCWQKNAVAKAVGTVDFFEDLRNPTFYGDIYSAMVRVGGRKRRKDGSGIVAIVQAVGA